MIDLKVVACVSSHNKPVLSGSPELLLDPLNLTATIGPKGVFISPKPTSQPTVESALVASDRSPLLLARGAIAWLLLRWLICLVARNLRRMVNITRAPITPPRAPTAGE
jgi:hypothetical protein